MKSSLDSRHFSGFTLPEVTISLAVTALGITSLLGLIPQGMETMRKAGNIASETRIIQQIIGTLTQAQWQDDKGNDVLTSTYQNRRYYYDDMAVELDPADPGQSKTYIAEVGIAPQDVALPGSAASQPAGDPFLRRVTIKIANATADDFDFKNAGPTAIHTYASVVTRAGK